MQFINKDKLSYKDGYIIDADGNIMIVSPLVVFEMNELEKLAQLTAWFIANPEPEYKEPEQFERESEHVTPKLGMHMDTPVLDALVEERAKLFDELAMEGVLKKMEEAGERFMHALRFAASNTMVTEVSPHMVDQFDLPTIGNPLKITPDKIADIICDYVAAKAGWGERIKAEEE